MVVPVWLVSVMAEVTPSINVPPRGIVSVTWAEYLLYLVSVRSWDSSQEWEALLEFRLEKPKLKVGRYFSMVCRTDSSESWGDKTATWMDRLFWRARTRHSSKLRDIVFVGSWAARVTARKASVPVAAIRRGMFIFVSPSAVFNIEGRIVRPPLLVAPRFDR